MTTNETRRSVMNMAWGLFREAVATGDRRYTFAQALAGAWRFMKRLAAMKPLSSRARNGVVHFSSTIRSPIIQRQGRRAFAGGRGSAVYLTARMGG